MHRLIYFHSWILQFKVEWMVTNASRSTSFQLQLLPFSKEEGIEVEYIPNTLLGLRTPLFFLFKKGGVEWSKPQTLYWCLCLVLTTISRAEAEDEWVRPEVAKKKFRRFKFITTRTTIRSLGNFVTKSIINFAIFLPVLQKFIPIPVHKQHGWKIRWATFPAVTVIHFLPFSATSGRHRVSTSRGSRSRALTWRIIWNDQLCY